MSDFDDEGLNKFLEAEEKDLKPIDLKQKVKETKQAREEKVASMAVPEALKGDILEEQKNLIHAGEYVDMKEKDPTLKRLHVGAGWEQKSFEDKALDIDLSVFLLDKKDQTRVDEDFVFYNNLTGCEGAVQHMSDNRSGAGEGDDEVIVIDLNGVPFDVAKLMFVITVYDENFDGMHFGMVRNIFLRLVNKDDNNELVRFVPEDKIVQGGNALYAAVLIREGPKWIFEALGKVNNGGLALVAKEYGIIVQELQSTAITGTDAEQRARMTKPDFG